MTSVVVQDFSQSKGLTIQATAVSLSIPVVTTSLRISGGNNTAIRARPVSNSLKAIIT